MKILYHLFIALQRSFTENHKCGFVGYIFLHSRLTRDKCSCFVLKMDFEEKYRERTRDMVFAPYRDEMVSRAGIEAAIQILEEASEKVLDFLMQTDDVQAAIDYLRPCLGRPALLNRFWSNLAIENPVLRFEAVQGSLKAIKREVGLAGS